MKKFARTRAKNERRRRRETASRHQSLYIPMSLLVVVVTFLSTAHAWVPTHQSSCEWLSKVYGSKQEEIMSQVLYRQPFICRRFGPLLASSDDTPTDNSDDDGISDLDARVLQSMLQDTQKLDLQQEENMRQLLERGVKSKERVESPKKQEEDDSEYSSKVVKTLSDTKLWKALSRNWQDAVESAQIALQNRIERDAKLVASLGIFALDRALQDVSRALPAAASAINKQRNKVLQLSDTSSYEEPPKVDLRKEFATPQDEIKSVSAEIKSIFQQADAQTTQAKSARAASDQRLIASATSLKSTARRGNARLSQAYQRQQKTKLAREKENIAQSGTRLASKAIDSAYQVQRELQIEPNQPGYKTKRLRAATASTAKLLASAAKAGGSFLLGGKKQQDSTKQLPQQASSNPTTATAKPPSFVDATFVDASVVEAEEPTGMDATAAAMDSFFYAQRKQKAEPPTKPKSKTYSVTADPVDFLDSQPYFAFKRGGSTTAANVEETKTTSQLIENELISTQTTPYVDAMEDTQESATVPPQASTAPPIQDIITAEVMTDTLDDIIDEAMQDVDNVIVDDNNNKYFYTGSEYVELEEEQENELVVDALDENLRQVTAEVISDDDFENVFGQAKAVDNLGEDFDDELEEVEDKEPSLLTKVTLRSLDILFLVVEKTVLLIPDVLVVTTRVATRISEVNREGLGQVGWEPLNTKIRGSKRY